MLPSQIIPPLPSPRVQKTVLYICVSFALSHIESKKQCFNLVRNTFGLKIVTKVIFKHKENTGIKTGK